MTNQNSRGVTAVPARPTNPWAVAALVFSPFAWQSLVIALLTATFAVIALDQIKQRGQGGRDLAHFARAFAVMSLIVLLVCGGDWDWTAYPLFRW